MASRAKKRKELLNNHFKAKKGYFDFENIKKYWSKRSKKGIQGEISDRTYNDLDLDELFMLIDRTVSKVGQQYLYNRLRSVPGTPETINNQETWITRFSDNPELKNECLVRMAELNKGEAYYLSSLFQDDYLQKPKWFWLIKLMASLSIACLLGIYFIPQLLILLIFLLAINYGIHYWNKKNLFEYGGSIPQLLLLIQVSKQLTNLTAHKSDDLNQAIIHLSRIGKSLSIFKMEATLQSDVGQAGEFLVEIIRALFLIEPLALFRALKKLNAHKEDIHKLFSFVAEIDTAISVDSLRKTLDIHCRLDLENDQANLVAVDLYHPLLENPVPNSINVHGKSVLLTGSNMSGKTTFIRTIALNAITGQALNVCFAKEFQMPQMQIHSAIRIADDMMSDKSYYFEEVLTIKEMLDNSRSGPRNLFLLDELFKGTNTMERIAAGKAILSYLNSSGNMVFIATHDLELVGFLKDEYDLYHFSEVIREGQIVFDYELKTGNLEQTNAIKILEVNGFPTEVISEANRIVNEIKGI